jgi:hypothetical protein
MNRPHTALGDTGSITSFYTIVLPKNEFAFMDAVKISKPKLNFMPIYTISITYIKEIYLKFQQNTTGSSCHRRLK